MLTIIPRDPTSVSHAPDALTETAGENFSTVVEITERERLEFEIQNYRDQIHGLPALLCEPEANTFALGRLAEQLAEGYQYATMRLSLLGAAPVDPPKRSRRQRKPADPRKLLRAELSELEETVADYEDAAARDPRLAPVLAPALHMARRRAFEIRAELGHA